MLININILLTYSTLGNTTPTHLLITMEKGHLWVGPRYGMAVQQIQAAVQVVLLLGHPNK